MKPGMKQRAPKGNRWADHYTRRAQKENYPARSVYKLQQIQTRYRILKKGQRVLDLGCAPGSWLLYAAKLVGAAGQVTGIDLKPLKGRFSSQVTVLQADVLERGQAPWTTMKADFQVLLSDMAPATTGRREVDATRSAQLAQAALEIAQSHLQDGGAFICKIFEGPEVNSYIQMVGDCFQQVKRFRPAATRKASSELYIVATGKHSLKQENMDTF
ncbi:MAG: RlmE family RNA methyltransferase [Desulfobacterales bacterium]